MPLVERLIGVVGDLGELRRSCLREELYHVLVKPLLIPLERQHLVGALGKELLGDGRLAAGGIDGNHRSLEVQQLEQGRQGGDLVAPLWDGQVPEEKVVGADPGTDEL